MSTRPSRVLLISIFTAGACGGTTADVETGCYPTTLALDRCDPTTARFSLASTNPYYPLVVGHRWVMEGMDGAVHVRVVRTVLAETREVGGVTAHVLEHENYRDDVVHEVAHNFYVEAADGTVCYFGEDVENYEGGAVANTNGSWRVGADGAKPGIIMPASPKAGDAYFQEQSLGQAMDMGRVTSVDQPKTIGGMAYEKVLTVKDANPIDPENACEEEEKSFVRDIGEIGDVYMALVSFERGS